MTDEQISFHFSFDAMVSSVREEFERLPGRVSSVESLSEWFQHLRSLDLVSIHSNFKLVQCLKAEGKNHPSVWCKEHKLDLDEELDLALGGKEIAPADSPINSLGLYVLGRAAILSILRRPEDTNGLMLAYKLFEECDYYNIALSAIDDELKDRKIENFPQAIAEIDLTIDKIAAAPGALETDARFKLILSDWKEAVGVQQSVSRWFDNVALNLPLRNILLVVALHLPELAARWLDNLGHPALQASVLIDRQRADIDLLLKLLPFCSAAFDSDGKWLHKQGSRVLIDALENRLVELIVQGNRSPEGYLVADANWTMPASVTDQLQKFQTILSQRSDGKRLAVEWIAHLVQNQIFSESPSGVKSIPGSMLLNAAGDLFGKQQWTTPAAVKILFQDSQIDASSPQKANPPAWINTRGEKDAVTPVLVASILNMASSAPSADLLPWIKGVFSQIATEPYLLYLSVYPSDTLLGVLSWPVAMGEDSQGAKQFMQEIWTAAVESRLRARFYRYDNSPTFVYSCNAIAELGLTTLYWLKDKKNSAQLLAAYLQEVINEFRYCLPSLGLRSWSILVSKLATGCTIAGILDSPETLKHFLEQYDGDDDAQVAASVACAANGLAPKTIFEGLKCSNIEPSILAERWLSWNVSKYGEESPGVAQTKDFLTKIVQADVGRSQ